MLRPVGDPPGLAGLALGPERLPGLSSLLGSELPVVVEVGAVEMLERRLLRLRERQPAVLVQIGRIEHPAGEAAPGTYVHER